MKTEHINSLRIIIVSVALALGLSAAATSDNRPCPGPVAEVVEAEEVEAEEVPLR